MSVDNTACDDSAPAPPPNFFPRTSHNFQHKFGYENESISKHNEENQLSSIRYNGVDVYEACIETLKPKDYWMTTLYQFYWSK